LECEYNPSLHFAIAPVGSLSSALPEPLVAFDLLLAVEAVVRARLAAGAAAAAGAGVGAAAAAGVGAGVGAGAGAGAVGALAAPDCTPPCPEQAPRPPFDDDPSVQVTVADALAAVPLAEALAAFAAAAVAFLSTPPCPEHAPRPVVAEVLPSVQTVPLA